MNFNNLHDLGPSFECWGDFQNLPASAQYAIKCAAFYNIRYIIERNDVFGICLLINGKKDVAFVNLYTAQKYDVAYENTSDDLYRLYCEK